MQVWEPRHVLYPFLRKLCIFHFKAVHFYFNLKKKKMTMEYMSLSHTKIDMKWKNDYSKIRKVTELDV